MTRTMTITAAEWASVKDGTLWIVREAVTHEALSVIYGATQFDGLPPAEFVHACAPCETCGGSRCVVPPNCDCDKVTSLNYALCNHPPADCPSCRIELVGPCPHDCARFGGKVPGHVRGSNWAWVPCWCNGTGTVTLGHAYAVGQPLPIVRNSNDWEWGATDHIDVMPPYAYRRTPTEGFSEDTTSMTTDLAHYGPPETLVGKWALRVQVVA